MKELAEALRAADLLLAEIDDLYGAGILEDPEDDDPDDPRIPLRRAVEHYRSTRAATRGT